MSRAFLVHREKGKQKGRFTYDFQLISVDVKKLSLESTELKQKINENVFHWNRRHDTNHSAGHMEEWVNFVRIALQEVSVVGFFSAWTPRVQAFV